MVHGCCEASAAVVLLSTLRHCCAATWRWCCAAAGVKAEVGKALKASEGSMLKQVCAAHWVASPRPGCHLQQCSVPGTALLACSCSSHPCLPAHLLARLTLPSRLLPRRPRRSGARVQPRSGRSWRRPWQHSSHRCVSGEWVGTWVREWRTLAPCSVRLEYTLLLLLSEDSCAACVVLLAAPAADVGADAA